MNDVVNGVRVVEVVRVVIVTVVVVGANPVRLRRGVSHTRCVLGLPQLCCDGVEYGCGDLFSPFLLQFGDVRNCCLILCVQRFPNSRLLALTLVLVLLV